MWTIVGLGNPGEEYKNTRHNAGRIAVGAFIKAFDFDTPVLAKKHQGLFSSGKVGKQEVAILFPETFMNKSGLSVATLVKSKKKAEQLIVVHDDLDLPLGKIKISWNRGTGGHRGVLSIVKNLKTEGFIRIRIGVSPTTPSGKLKKPKGEEAVDGFIVVEFKVRELDELKKIAKKVSGALEMIIVYGAQAAMNEFNSN